MAIYRLKRFSLLGEQIYNEYNKIPKIINQLPRVIQEYYRLGLNKDFYDLIRLQECWQYNPYPVPIITWEIEPNKDGYTPLFAEDQDSADIGSATIYLKSGVLYKKSGVFFKKYYPIGDKEFKEFLLNSIGDDYSSVDNGDKIMVLEKKISDKICKL